MSKHGGYRPGAGRPRKWTFDDILTVGQACEVAWREAKAFAFEAEKTRLFQKETDIQSLWDEAQRVPVRLRKGWHDSEDGEAHRADVETELHMLNGTPDSLDPPARRIRIVSRPPRGTRKRIIAEVARRFSMTESATDNLWQAYRRFERELREPQNSAES